MRITKITEDERQTVRVSVRIPSEQYRALKSLVDEGIYSSISDVVREAITRLVKECSTP
ncbi:MAG: ribbon-helix-helix domain-containing protein [Thermofilaceae archaeon]